MDFNKQKILLIPTTPRTPKTPRTPRNKELDFYEESVLTIGANKFLFEFKVEENCLHIAATETTTTDLFATKLTIEKINTMNLTERDPKAVAEFLSSSLFRQSKSLNSKCGFGESHDDRQDQDLDKDSFSLKKTYTENDSLIIIVSFNTRWVKRDWFVFLSWIERDTIDKLRGITTYQTEKIQEILEKDQEKTHAIHKLTHKLDQLIQKDKQNTQIIQDLTESLIDQKQNMVQIFHDQNQQIQKLSHHLNDLQNAFLEHQQSHAIVVELKPQSNEKNWIGWKVMTNFLGIELFELHKNNETIHFSVSGIYRISCQIAGNNNTNYYLQFFVDGKPTMRNFDTITTNYAHSIALEKIFAFKKGQKLRIYSSVKNYSIDFRYSVLSIQRIGDYFS